MKLRKRTSNILKQMEGDFEEALALLVASLRWNRQT